MEKSNEALRLKNQLCFPIYLCAKEVISRYTPLLSKLDLTYTQYIVLMVLWEKKEASVKEIGAQVSLDSGTLTPLLKKLEKKGLIQRRRKADDERVVLISLTESGKEMEEKAQMVPERMAACFDLEPEEAMTLYRLLQKVTEHLEKSGAEA